MLAKPQRGLRICFRVFDMYVQEEEEADRTGNLWETLIWSICTCTTIGPFSRVGVLYVCHGHRTGILRVLIPYSGATKHLFIAVPTS